MGNVTSCFTSPDEAVSNTARIKVKSADSDVSACRAGRIADIVENGLDPAGATGCAALKIKSDGRNPSEVTEDLTDEDVAAAITAPATSAAKSDEKILNTTTASNVASTTATTVAVTATTTNTTREQSITNTTISIADALAEKRVVGNVAVISNDPVNSNDHVLSNDHVISNLPMTSNVPIKSNVPVISNLPVISNIPVISDIFVISNVPIKSDILVTSDIPMKSNVPMTECDGKDVSHSSVVLDGRINNIINDNENDDDDDNTNGNKEIILFKNYRNQSTLDEKKPIVVERNSICPNFEIDHHELTRISFKAKMDWWLSEIKIGNR